MLRERSRLAAYHCAPLAAKAKRLELTKIHSAAPMIATSSPHWPGTTSNEGAGGLNFSGIVAGSMSTSIPEVACSNASYGNPSVRVVSARRTLVSEGSHANDYVMYNTNRIHATVSR